MRKSRLPALAVISVIVLCFIADPAAAHSGEGLAGGFSSGFLHPVFGLDHVIAMVAVGLWGAFLGMPAIWLLPVVFPLVMAFGGILGISGVALPHVETGIAVSAIILGLCVATAFRPPLWVAAILVGSFAIFHGHAHGAELPQAANPLAYSAGFVVATGLLHVAGISFGLLAGSRLGAMLVKVAGAAIALGGVYFLAA
ncbi:MAG: HupE/UreJ family protein [Nitratireductor sp.]|nr:HupE/UreJ family protein [Nitratireductor sp.]MCB1458029.1 HupE/UreJ family protein [Nitratireductor sp.]